MTHELRPFDLSGVQGLSKKAIDLHLGLYKGYVDNLNKLIEQTAKGSGSPLAMDGYNRRFAFEYNGVTLHELFFEQLAGRHRQPLADSDWAEAVKEQFGDFNGWKSKIEGLAATRGVGWVMTSRERGSSRLHNFWVDLHHLHMPAESRLVFVLDVWEHAFMIDFTPAQKGEYVKTVLENVDWAVVEQRYAAFEAREAAHA
jgi:Fe-Mn family superoxide dismutase